MVYGGKPSTGCYLCRKRKIKCDEGRPGCRNCSVYGRPCPGYRPDAVFRNETNKLHQLKQKETPSDTVSSASSKRSPADYECSSEDGVIEVYRKSPASGSNASPFNLITIPDASWQQRAICFFFDQYTVDRNGDEGGHMDYLPPLYAQLENQSREPSNMCLQWATDATSLMAYAKASGASALMNKARQGYGLAIRSLREALISPSQAIKDETFASVVLLSIFEDISGERNGLHSSHTAGFEFLMKLRGESQFKYQRGRDLFNFAYAQMHVEILALGEKPRGSLDGVIDPLSDTNDPTEQLLLRSADMSRLYMSMQSASFPLVSTTVEKWILDMHEIDRGLQQWALTLPEHWLPLVVYSSQGEQLLTHNHGTHGVLWCYYRALRVMVQLQIIGLNRTLLSVMQQSQDTPGEDLPHAGVQVDEDSLHSVIKEITTDVCRSIPFFASQVDIMGRPMRPGNNMKKNIRAAQSFGLLWPLWYILTCGMPSFAQIEQIRSLLYYIGNIQGIHLALVLARKFDSV